MNAARVDVIVLDRARHELIRKSAVARVPDGVARVAGRRAGPGARDEARDDPAGGGDRSGVDGDRDLSPGAARRTVPPDDEGATVPGCRGASRPDISGDRISAGADGDASAHAHGERGARPGDRWKIGRHGAAAREAPTARATAAGRPATRSAGAAAVRAARSRAAPGGRPRDGATTGGVVRPTAAEARAPAPP